MGIRSWLSFAGLVLASFAVLSPSPWPVEACGMFARSAERLPSLAYEQV